MRHKTTLEQWNTLAMIERAGSIQQAAQLLNKSHTTLIYAIRKLEQQLGVTLLQLQGRKTVLTAHGKSLLRKALPMLEQAKDLELIGQQLAQGMESEIRISIDHLCDKRWLYTPLKHFLANNKATSVQIIETSLSSTRAAVVEQQVDIALINIPIKDHLAQAFGAITMLPVVAKNHPLAKLPSVSLDHLTAETQIVIRDLGKIEKQEQNVGWLKSHQRITVDNFDHALGAVQEGLGFCRVPSHLLAQQAHSDLVALPLQYADSYQVPIHISLPKKDKTAKAALHFYKMLMEAASQRNA